MFKDYYEILGISQDMPQEGIRKSYRAMSLKCHPDKNPNIDVTSIMQDINEAYSILKDQDKRHRYDIEYDTFKFSYNKEFTTKESASSNGSQWTYEYNVHDETVKEDMDNARQTAKKMVEEFMNSLKKTTVDAWNGMKIFIWATILVILMSVIVKACHYG